MPKQSNLPFLLAALVPLVGISAGCATAPAPSPAYTAEQLRIDRLLEELHLPDYAGSLQRAALRVAGHPEDGQLAQDQRLRPRLETQLASDAVVSDVVRRVAESFDEPAVAQIERFAASDLGREVHEASGAPYSWFSRLGYRIFGAPDPESPQRVELARRLDELTVSTQTTIQLYMRIYESIVRWYEARGFVDPQESEAVGGIDELLTNERKRVEAIGAQHSLHFTLYAFSDLSTPELAEYVALIESAAGQWYAKAVREALVETIDRRTQAIQR
jgi:hypothetical protein